jgi:AcrR family transcriptional regulator
VPKIVDHEERREEVIAAVWRVIEREGIENSTIRRIAKEAGYSAGILAHYFVDKADILTAALQLSHQRILARWDSKLAGLDGLEAVRELVLDNLPLDESRALETKLEISYWARSLSRQEVVEVQRTEASVLHGRMLELLTRAQETGELSAPETPAEITELLLALIDGLSLHAILYPERLTPGLQIDLVDREIDRLRGTRS